MNNDKNKFLFHARCIIIFVTCLTFPGCADGPDRDMGHKIFVTHPELNMVEGDEIQITASPTNKTFTWESSNTAVATVSATGLVRAVADGACFIYITGDEGFKRTIPVDVVGFIPLTGIEVINAVNTTTVETISVLQGQYIDLEAKAVPENYNERVAFNVIWASADENIAVIDETTGRLRGINSGSTEIIVSSVEKPDVRKVISVEVPRKHVSFRFKETLQQTWVGYYFKSSDKIVSSALVGSNEFIDNEQVTISFEIDLSLLDEYNAAHGGLIQLMPQDAYSVPDMNYTGTADYQNMSFEVTTTSLNDRTVYAIPVKIKSVSKDVIDEANSRFLFLYHVDDFAGWYTVDRLEKSSSAANAYTREDRRRYVKRTGANTWETGYIFSSYYNTEEAGTTVLTNIMFITLTVETKFIHIIQGTYTSEIDMNAFDPEINELTVEFEYLGYNNYWIHERMYNRGFSR